MQHAGPPVSAEVTRLIDQPRVDRYADAARDHNLIHLNAEYAATTPFGRPIAHGMFVLALVSEAMSSLFGRRWAEGGSLRVRMRAPAKPPVVVTARASLRSHEGGRATYDVSCEDASGTVLLSGTASAPWA